MVNSNQECNTHFEIYILVLKRTDKCSSLGCSITFPGFFWPFHGISNISLKAQGERGHGYFVPSTESKEDTATMDCLDMPANCQDEEACQV
jgi:hypothetical protein